MITARYINLRYYHYIGIFSLIFIMLLVIIREQLKSPVKLDDLINFELDAEIFMEDVSYAGYSKDSKIRLNAKSATLVKSDRIDFNQLKINMPQDDKKEIIIKANEGDYNTTSEIAMLKGDVSINLADKNLLTHFLYYEKKNDIVWTDQGFKLYSNDFETEGKSISYDLKNGKLILKDQKSIIKGDDFSVE